MPSSTTQKALEGEQSSLKESPKKQTESLSISSLSLANKVKKATKPKEAEEVSKTGAAAGQT